MVKNLNLWEDDPGSKLGSSNFRPLVFLLKPDTSCPTQPFQKCTGFSVFEALMHQKIDLQHSRTFNAPNILCKFMVNLWAFMTKTLIALVMWDLILEGQIIKLIAYKNGNFFFVFVYDDVFCWNERCILYVWILFSSLYWKCY